MRGGGFGPPPPHEGQISTLPPSNLRLSQSCQALSWATPESGPNFSAFKACSRRQVVTGSASASHTAKPNPRARHGVGSFQRIVATGSRHKPCQDSGWALRVTLAASR